MRKNEASYQAARRYQAAHPGTSYTRAKRIAAANASGTPLSATFAGPDGRAVHLSLVRSAELSGSQVLRGSHVLVIGADSAGLLPVLADALAAGQDDNDIEILYSTAESPTFQIASRHHFLAHRQLADHVNQLKTTRLELVERQRGNSIEDLRARGLRIPRVVVLVEDPGVTLVDDIATWSRVGRGLGINFVVSGASTPVPHVGAAEADVDVYRSVVDRAVLPVQELVRGGMFGTIAVTAPGRAALLLHETVVGGDPYVVSSLPAGEARTRVTSAEFVFDAPAPL